MDYKLMIKPALFVQWNVGCNQSQNYPVEEEILVQPFFAAFFILAFLFNTIAILIFTFQPKKFVMRFNLISLSISESFFNGILIIYFLLNCTDLLVINLNKYSNPSWARIEITPRIYKIAIILIDIMVCQRNWCNLLIAASRAEVISASIGRKRFFRRSTLIKIMAVVLILSIILAVLRSCNIELLICKDNERGIYYSEERVYLPNLILKTFTLLWFFIQCIIPWIGVMISSIIMSTVIFSNFRKHQRLVTGASQCKRRRNTSTALRTVLGLALTFTICELPTFIFAIFSGFELSGVEKYKVLIFIGNTLIVLDSIINFCVYAVAMPQFRTDVCRLLHCQKLGNRTQHNIFSPTNYPFAKCNPNQLLLNGNKSKKFISDEI